MYKYGDQVCGRCGALCSVEHRNNGNKVVLVRVDNTSAVAWLNRLGHNHMHLGTVLDATPHHSVVKI
jgi:hypothetical protein